MKIRINKTIILAVVFIFLMLGSTIAIGIQRLLEPTGEAIKLPETNIINYELGIREEETLILKGVTIIKFYYISNCLECYGQQSYLESLTNQYPDQMLLEKIHSNQTTGTFPKIIVKSYRGQRTLTNATNEEVTDAVCELMLKPPAQCAIRNI